jgi:hypothetical protein
MWLGKRRVCFLQNPLGVENLSQKLTENLFHISLMPVKKCAHSWIRL